MTTISCTSGEDASGLDQPSVEVKNSETMTVKTVPKEFQSGQGRFNTFCRRCHGKNAQGTDMGPPLVHKIYEPSHHGDFAFFRAAAQGVKAHHWKFGNMPKIYDATPQDVAEIIPYVRWLQREAGIY